MDDAEEVGEEQEREEEEEEEKEEGKEGEGASQQVVVLSGDEDSDSGSDSSSAGGIIRSQKRVRIGDGRGSAAQAADAEMVTGGTPEDRFNALHTQLASIEREWKNMAPQTAGGRRRGTTRGRRSFAGVPRASQADINAWFKSSKLRLCTAEKKAERRDNYVADFFFAGIGPKDVALCGVCGVCIAVSSSNAMMQHMVKYHEHLLHGPRLRHENRLQSQASQGTLSALWKQDKGSTSASGASSSASSSASSATQLGRPRKYSNRLLQACMRFVVTTHTAFHITRHESLRDMIKAFVEHTLTSQKVVGARNVEYDRIEIPSPMTLSRELTRESEECTGWVRKLLKAQVDSMPLPSRQNMVWNPDRTGVQLGPLVLISDMWSTRTQKGMFGMIACFLDERFEWGLYLMACRPVNYASHCAEVMQQETKAILLEYNLTDADTALERCPSTMAMVTDGASVCKKAFKGWNVVCAPHTLSLVFKLILHTKSQARLVHMLRKRLFHLTRDDSDDPGELSADDDADQDLQLLPSDSSEDEEEDLDHDDEGDGDGEPPEGVRRHAAAGAARAAQAASARVQRDEMASVEECYELDKAAQVANLHIQIRAANDSAAKRLLCSVTKLRRLAAALHKSPKKMELLQQARIKKAQDLAAEDSAEDEPDAIPDSDIRDQAEEVTQATAERQAAAALDNDAQSRPVVSREATAQPPWVLPELSTGDKDDQETPEQRRERLLKAERKRLSRRVSVVLSNETRWTSMASLLHSAVRNQDLIDCILQEHRNEFKLRMSTTDWANVKALLKFTDILMSHLNSLQGDDMSPASAVLPAIHKLKQLCDKDLKNYKQFEGLDEIQFSTLEVVQHIIGPDLDRRFHLAVLPDRTRMPQHHFTTLRLATFLDPRYHNVARTQGRYIVQPATDDKAGIARTVAELKRITEAWAIALHRAAKRTSSDDDDDDATGEEDAEHEEQLKDIFDDDEDDAEPEVRSTQDESERSLISAEWAVMQEECRRKFSQSFCFKQWWRAHQERMPMLARVARAVLAIPASSAAVERLFSAAGLAMSPQRASMSDSTVDKLMRVLYYVR